MWSSRTRGGGSTPTARQASAQGRVVRPAGGQQAVVPGRQARVGEHLGDLAVDPVQVGADLLERRGGRRRADAGGCRSPRPGRPSALRQSTATRAQDRPPEALSGVVAGASPPGSPVQDAPRIALTEAEFPRLGPYRYLTCA